MTTNHDEVDGYFIPAGTIIIGNSWYVWSFTSNSDPGNSSTVAGVSFTTQLFIPIQADLIQKDSWPKAIISISPRWTRLRFVLDMAAGSVLVVLRPTHTCGSPSLPFWAFSISVLPPMNWVSLSRSHLLFRLGWFREFVSMVCFTNWRPNFFFSHPLPFKFSMKPRGASATSLIEQTAEFWVFF